MISSIGIFLYTLIGSLIAGAFTTLTVVFNTLIPYRSKDLALILLIDMLIIIGWPVLIIASIIFFNKVR